MPKKKQTFESAMQRLEEIVALLEQNNASLDDSLKLFEEGVSLISYCNETLENARLRVEKLTIPAGIADKEALPMDGGEEEQENL
ncbi:exodeoxyribonuclease VII small subunit [Zongyangia hominis]|uniref:Exodeoxyribonuclease 7 small subunit n=1 Tax=Zongyangia hominis TaxID=2763677 RepID=A0A926IAV1_9FIRM|nr:exodeoxyribonuclease VII small subunit [Zongyangia hominis]MBC8569598.1 exodeoxyribonuclease VII small subunit [Zongyangia hominis]